MKKRFFYSVLLLHLAFHFGCNRNNETKLIDQAAALRYATGFTFGQTGYGYLLTIHNPWQGASNEELTYRLISNDDDAITRASGKTIRVPVQRVVCLSTTHLAYLDALGAIHRVVGVSGSSYIWNEKVQEGIRNGTIADVGYEQSLNIELLLELQPDVVFAYGIGAESLSYIKRIEEMGIPVVVIGEYLENQPLGKTEWIKVFGLFTGTSELATNVFDSVEVAYHSQVPVIESLSSRPKVFLNLPWNDVWYLPGHKSYMAQLICDAGGDYLMSDLKGSQSYPFSFESALQRAAHADVWINLGSYQTIGQILTDFPTLRVLPALAKGNLFNNNLRENSWGGNDFWESGVMNPHLILEDLIGIFHPQLHKGKFHYYKKME